ncbi:hypothetical protein DID75_05420 [Candidatus Marinamargulisbacteria bacterium SCGC AG-410-N11]|nr:hypothetical protein DID75_05420 [Candidatus Marinamargulisbacteria bacterium SCGC AG-410-N11]
MVAVRGIINPTRLSSLVRPVSYDWTIYTQQASRKISSLTETETKIIKTYNECSTPHYQKLPIVFKKGNGIKLETVSGSTYFDMNMAYAASRWGHGPIPSEIIESSHGTIPSQAMHTQSLSEALSLTNTLFSKLIFNPNQEQTKVLILNTGGEIVDSAQQTFKRMYGPENTVIFIPIGNFNGRREFANRSNDSDVTVGVNNNQLNIDNQRRCFIEFNNIEQLDLAVKLAQKKGLNSAILLELIQGEGGVEPINKDYSQQISALQQNSDLFIIADEVQTWGAFPSKNFGAASHFYGIQPNMFLAAKCISPFVPVSIGVMTNTTAKNGVYNEGGTFSGNPLAANSLKYGLNKAFQDLGNGQSNLDLLYKRGSERLQVIQKAIQNNPFIEQVRGIGSMGGIVCKDEASANYYHDLLLNSGRYLNDKDNICGIIQKVAGKVGNQRIIRCTTGLGSEQSEKQLQNHLSILLSEPDLFPK